MTGQPRARHQGRAARRRGRRAGRRQPRAASGRTGSGCSSAPRGCSASRSRSRCGCCRVPEAVAHRAGRLPRAWRRRATPSPQWSPPGCCPGRWRSWTRWRSRPPRRRSSPDYPPARGAADRRARGRARSWSPRTRARCDELIARLGRRSRCAPPRTPAERALIWKGRKSAFSAVGWLAPDYIVQDGVVPRTRLGEALAEIERHGARARHARGQRLPRRRRQPAPADPVRRPRARRPRSAPRRWPARSCDMCVELGGSITGEHGVGMEKRDYLPLHVRAPTTSTLMQRCARAVDPARAGQPRQDARPPRRAARDGGRSTTRDAPALQRRRRASTPRVLPRGGGTKPALSTPAATTRAARRRGLRGIVEYDPRELTFTALAGTPVRRDRAGRARRARPVPAVRSAAGRRGATLGGVVAAGRAGPARYRYGGVRDFIIGVRFVDGTGRLVGGGGKVVKNAAGFDLPKLMVGSARAARRARRAVASRSSRAARVGRRWRADGAARSTRRSRRPRWRTAAGLDIEALDLEPPGRAAGAARRSARRARAAARARCAARSALPAERAASAPTRPRSGTTPRELAWVPPAARAGPGRAHARAAPPALDARAGAAAARRYTRGGGVGWVAWPPDRALDELDAAAARRSAPAACG